MGHAAAIPLAVIADRCNRALSTYECRRRYAFLAGRGGQPEDDGPDLYSTLRPAQQRAIERGVADARAEADALRAATQAHDPGDLAGGFGAGRVLAERGVELRRDAWRRRQRRARALRGRSPEGATP